MLQLLVRFSMNIISGSNEVPTLLSSRGRVIGSMFWRTVPLLLTDIFKKTLTNDIPVAQILLFVPAFSPWYFPGTRYRSKSVLPPKMTGHQIQAVLILKLAHNCCAMFLIWKLINTLCTDMNYPLSWWKTMWRARNQDSSCSLILSVEFQMCLCFLKAQEVLLLLNSIGSPRPQEWSLWTHETFILLGTSFF